jgi:hypothetical protein
VISEEVQQGILHQLMCRLRLVFSEVDVGQLNMGAMTELRRGNLQASNFVRNSRSVVDNRCFMIEPFLTAAELPSSPYYRKRERSGRCRQSGAAPCWAAWLWGNSPLTLSRRTSYSECHAPGGVS